MQKNSALTVVTFGTFDLFHIGHLKLLQRASNIGQLHVGISTDELNIRKKGRSPIYNQEERRSIVEALQCVAGTFFEESLELKLHYIASVEADVLVMGDDWKGKFDFAKNICKVLYLERTPSVSTTATIEVIKNLIGFDVKAPININSSN